MSTNFPKSLTYGCIAVLASFTSCIEKAIAETPKASSPKSAIAGTWKLTPAKPPVFNVRPMPPLKIIITQDGKVYVKDPLRQNEYIEAGVIQKTSENASLPTNAKIVSPYASPNRARQAEAKAYVGSMNRGQQAHFLERVAWSKNIQDLGIDIKPETENYRYSIKLDPAIATSKAKPKLGIAINLGIAKQPDIKSYVGIVYLKDIDSSGDMTSFAILCESNQPTMQPPSQPRWNGKEMTCPEGYISMY